MTQKVIPDSETLAVGQQVLTACAFIYKIEHGEPRVLLAKRATTKKFFPGIFELPGGHVEYGEEMEAGLRREVQEELGVAIEVGDVVGVFTYMNNIKLCQSIEVVYFARLTDPETNIVIHPEDHSEWRWCSASELAETIESAGKTMEDKEAQLIRLGFSKLRI